MLRFLSISLVAALSLAAQPRSGQGQLDASPALFTVLAAINAAGYDADIDSASNHPLRAAIRQEIARRKPPSLEEVREFFRQHRQQDGTWELRQYISFGVMVDAPAFEFRISENQLPPDVAALRAMGPILSKFYTEAGIEDLWKRSQPAFDEAIARYHEPVSAALLEVNGYLRNPTSGGWLGRRFQIYVDLLGAPNQIHIRSFLDEYFIVVTPSAEPHVPEVRTAYLHYLLDPLATKYLLEIDKKRGLGDYAQGSGALPDQFKQDFLLLTTRSLIRAVEARIAHFSRRAQMIGQALKEGFVLTPHFAEQLAVYEKQEQAMRLYFPELISSIDLRKEERRLAGVEFLQSPVIRKARVAPVKAPEPSGPEKTALEAQDLQDKKELDKARDVWMRLLRETGEKRLHAKAYHALGRIAALQKNPEMAEKLFLRSLELDLDPMDRGWSLVFLGRLSDLAGERDGAVNYYQAALAVPGVSDKAREAAQQGLKETFPKK
ncbi:MAG: tetratricopeptide repeat protein [Bryobacteraceae bacterium]